MKLSVILVNFTKKEMFNAKTIDRIKTQIFIALGDKDFYTRKQLQRPHQF